MGCLIFCEMSDICWIFIFEEIMRGYDSCVYPRYYGFGK